MGVEEFVWTSAMLANVITVFLFFIYLWPGPALNFQRSQALTKDDFSLFTNDYTSAKYILVVLIPNLCLPLVFTSFFMRLIVIRFYGNFVFASSSSSSSSKEEEAEENDKQDNLSFYTTLISKRGLTEELDRFMDILKWLHLAFTLLAMIAFITSLVFLIIDFSNCNTLDSKNNNICNSLLYCCASDVLTPPGITNHCPHINSCSLDVFTTHDLNPDPYFIWIFIMTILILVFLVAHFLLGYVGEFIIVINNENSTMSSTSNFETRGEEVNKTLINTKIRTLPTTLSLSSLSSSSSSTLVSQSREMTKKPGNISSPYNLFMINTLINKKD